jgi:hypothetical protein
MSRQERSAFYQKVQACMRRALQHAGAQVQRAPVAPCTHAARRKAAIARCCGRQARGKAAKPCAACRQVMSRHRH